jgi:hypothetical protein
VTGRHHTGFSANGTLAGKGVMILANPQTGLPLDPESL